MVLRLLMNYGTTASQTFHISEFLVRLPMHIPHQHSKPSLLPGAYSLATLTMPEATNCSTLPPVRFFFHVMLSSPKTKTTHLHCLLLPHIHVISYLRHKQPRPTTPQVQHPSTKSQNLINQFKICHLHLPLPIPHLPYLYVIQNASDDPQQNTRIW